MVSVIVPVYNMEKYLRPCLESLRAQTFCDFEALIVNDGSTDRSESVIDEFVIADSRFKRLNRPNGGLSAARNTGIESAKGDWLVFLDSDDMLHPEALRLMTEVTGERGADIGCFRWECGKEPEFRQPGPLKIKMLTPVRAASDVLYRCGGMEPSACAKIFRKKLFDIPRFRTGTGYEDVDLIYRVMLAAGKVAVANRKVYFYRQRLDSFMHVWQRGRLDILGVVDGIEKFCEENHPELLTAARDRKFAAYFNIFLLASKNGANEIAERCWPVIRGYRFGSLFAPHARLKNRVGAVVSYGGHRFTSFLARFF